MFTTMHELRVSTITYFNINQEKQWSLSNDPASMQALKESI